MHARRRIEMITDEGSFEEWDVEMPESKPCIFPGYEKKLAEVSQKNKFK